MRLDVKSSAWLCSLLLACMLATFSRVQAASTLIGEWRLDENSWTHAGGQVVDSSTYGLNGQALNGAETRSTTPARTGDPGTCRYASFDGADDYVQVADNTALKMASQVSVTAWIYPRAYGGVIVSKGANYQLALDSSGHVVWSWGGGTLSTTSVTVPLNQWSHIVTVYKSGSQAIYVNGSSAASAVSTATTALSASATALRIGHDPNGVGGFWNGYIDDVRIYSVALTASQVPPIYTASHSCAITAGSFAITHDGRGVNCAPELVTVSVRDINNNPLNYYRQSMTLDTQSGRGTWSLVSGTGVFNDATANDGKATYQWAAGQSTATFSLSYPEGAASIDIDAYQTGSTSLRDDDTEVRMEFDQNQFVITSSPLGATQEPPFPAFGSPQKAGTAFDVYITKYGATANNPACHIVTDYQGTKSLKVWSSYVDPGSGTLALSFPGTASSGVGKTEATATTASVSFSQGAAHITGLYKDVGMISFAVKDSYEAGLTPPVDTRGSSGNFVAQPAYFAIAATSNPAATDASGAVYRAAGDPFTMTVTAMSSTGSKTPNFGKERTPESFVLIPTIVQPIGGSGGSYTGTFGAFVNGVATSTNFTWSEVGIVRFTGKILDGDYLGSNDIDGQPSGNIGRFKPADFLVELQSGSLAASCSTFSYLGQPLKYDEDLVIRVTARNRQGGTTTNYRLTDPSNLTLPSFFKLSNTSFRSPTSVVSTPVSSTNTPVYSLSDNTTITHVHAPSPEWNLNSMQDGTALLTFKTGAGIDDGLVIDKRTPRVPFNAIVQLKFKVFDADGVTTATAATPVVIGGGTGIPFAHSEQRYGRLAFRNGLGSERVALPMPLRMEYYLNAASGFVVDDESTCLSNPTLTLKDYVGHLDPLETNPTYGSLPSNGLFKLVLSAPGDGNDGRVKVEAQARAWQQIWDAKTSTLANPWGVATFGLFQGNSKRVYQREMYSGAP